MNRFRLSAKLALAVIPIGLVALLATGFIANSFLKDSAAQSESARAATVTAEALDTLNAVWDEQTQARQLHVFFQPDATDDYASAVEATDVAFNRLQSSVSALASATQGLSNQVAVSASEQVDAIADELARIRAIDTPTESEVAGYNAVAEDVLSLMPKFSSLVSDRVQARDLSTAYFLAEGGQVSFQQEQLVEEFRATAFPSSSATATSNSRNTLQATLEILESDFASWGLRAAQTANASNPEVAKFAEPAPVEIDTFPAARNAEILNLSEDLTKQVAAESSANAGQSEREAYLVAGVAAIVLLLALWGAYSVIRSIVRRVRGITAAATQVSEVDLPNLVEALQNPNESMANLQPTTIEAAGSDEVGELADSFNSLHATLIDVAGQQMEILRKGVSEIFVTLARRNRSLVDRQLALLDELESREEDPETLGGYYKLDHLSTRMRRNAESLLVLAGTEPTRIWANPLDVSEIVRAALGEVDEYQRVDILALEPALVSGRAVADIAHLMSELLDNGTQYSSPTDRVRVSGLFDPEGYMLTVSDSGIGVSDSRLADLNELLESPPVLGLALEPTLGMYVVARLAARHGIKVQLILGSPGLTVRVLLPKALIETAKTEEPGAPKQRATQAIQDTPEYRPAIRVTPSSATPEPVASSNGSAAGHMIGGHRIPAPGDRPASRPRPWLPGNIKGKHEQTGRPETAENPVFSDEPAPELTESPAAVTPEAESPSPLGLVRRVPGEALRASNPDAFDDAEDAADSEPDVSPIPEAQEWTEPVGSREAKTEPSISEAEPVSTDSTSDSPWWAAASDESAKSEIDRESETSKEESPFEFWDNDFQAELSTKPAPEAVPTVLSGAGLPVRTPGTNFTETDDTASSAAVSDSGAMGIRSALASFESGRDLAQNREEDETNNPEGTQQ